MNKEANRLSEAGIKVQTDLETTKADLDTANEKVKTIQADLDAANENTKTT